ncbi:MAG: peptidase T [Planctomycetota bacterium]|nr:MAG: peptidase T [Planctomycetota bacterium]
MHIPINRDRLLDRFLRYVRICTTADGDADSYPSSPGQLELGRILVQELRQAGIEDAHQDEHGLVWGTVPATVDASVPTILFNAHLDTSPDAPGENVRPQVIENYAGGDIPLPRGNQVIRVADAPELAHLQGHCLITTDGSTLLGGDDKSGVAVIMETAQSLMETPSVPHGPVRLMFTCDEEIGRGARYFDAGKCGAVAGYTLDGQGSGEVENENFSADQLNVRAIGYSIHPGIAKGKMKSALRALSALVAELPTDELTPETTDGRQGFLHPVALNAAVGEGLCKILLRDFDTSRLDQYEAIVRRAADKVQQLIPGVQLILQREKQYRNMAEYLRAVPHVVDWACEAYERLGRPWTLGFIRGGTDGAQFSERGLPTPNLSTGQHNIHSVREFASLTEMVWAAEHLVALLDLWQQRSRS